MQSWRALLRRPAWLALAATTLALGVAATTAVFALLDRALLQPLPYPESEQLVLLGLNFDEEGVAAAPGFRTALGGLEGVQSMGLVAGPSRNTNIAIGDTAEVVKTRLADHRLVPTLGLPMAAGRNFSPDEDRPNGPAAVILGHGFWKRHYGGDPQAVGSTLQVEGRAVPIIGVLPPGFLGSGDFDLLLPMQVSANSTSMATNELLIARLAPGASAEGVSAAVDPLLRGAYAAQPGVSAADLEWLRNVTMAAVPMSQLSRPANVLWMFLAAAGCVLLIAAINLANLMLFRSLARSHDSAVRLALGAPRARLALPALADGLLVGLCGALLGLVLGWATLRLFAGLVPAEWALGGEVGITPRSVLLALAAGIAVAFAGGALAVWRAMGSSPARELVGGGRTGWSRGTGRLGRGLVVAQVAVASVLLITAGLFGHSLYRLLSVPMGFETRDIVTFTLSPVEDRHPDLASSLQQTDRISAAIARLPGVEAVAVANVPPTSAQFNLPVEFADGRGGTVQYRMVTPGYAGVLGMPLLAGRMIGDSDLNGSEPVAVVSAAFARAYLDGDPLGKTVRLGWDDEQPMRIVGVLGDSRQFGPGQAAPAIVYAPLSQVPGGVWDLVRQYVPLSYMVRLHPGAGLHEHQVRDAVASASPMQPIAGFQTMEAVVASVTGKQRLDLLLVGVFSGLALILACVGLYAVAAVAVEARRHEFGVRAALGAPPDRLFRQVLQEGLRQVALGLAIGLAVALAMSRVLQSMLYDIDVADPVAIGAVLLVLGAAGALASVGPALRAARVPPMQALRVD
nr:ADOP family duplicated permease [Lysobacter sp. GX 14042]